MASRVPLLLKNKARKPTRLPIAPRAKPSNGTEPHPHAFVLFMMYVSLSLYMVVYVCMPCE